MRTYGFDQLSLLRTRVFGPGGHTVCWLGPTVVAPYGSLAHDAEGARQLVEQLESGGAKRERALRQAQSRRGKGAMLYVGWHEERGRYEVRKLEPGSRLEGVVHWFHAHGPRDTGACTSVRPARDVRDRARAYCDRLNATRRARERALRESQAGEEANP